MEWGEVRESDIYRESKKTYTINAGTDGVAEVVTISLEESGFQLSNYSLLYTHLL